MRNMIVRGAKLRSRAGAAMLRETSAEQPNTLRNSSSLSPSSSTDIPANRTQAR
ncbi:hypothetical protein FHY04_002617 [Sphingomonas sp. BK481]|nr:hypothetical protein [Sphingomonas sp. BK481]